MMRSKHLESRGDDSELLFGDATVECGVDSVPGVLGGCWRVVRVAVECFDEFLCAVAKSSCGFEDEWGQVDARVPVELFLFFA